MAKKKIILVGIIFIVLIFFSGMSFGVYFVINNYIENQDPTENEPVNNIHDILPNPIGTYSIGNIQFELRDDSRYEDFTSEPDDYRTLLIKSWYPADHSQTLVNSRLTYQEPAIYFKNLSKIPTHSYSEIPISNLKSNYPVLIFSHGYGSYEGLYQILMEALASSGYIIFSLNHPYEAAFTYFSSLSFIKMEVELPTLNSYGRNLMDILKSPTRTFEEKFAALELLEDNEFWSDQLKDSLDLWTEDSQFVLDYIEQINSEEDSGTNNIFYQRLDLENIGAIGHSFGGATAGEMCLIDSRIKAGINMDGIEIGQALHDNLTVPFMFMYSEENSLMNDVLFLQAENDAYSLITEDSKHMNYADSNIVLSYFEEIGHNVGPLGSIDGYRMLEIMNVYVVSFFNKYLYNIESPLLNGNSPDFPEVDLEIRN